MESRTRTPLQDALRQMRGRVNAMRERVPDSDEMTYALDDVLAALEALVPVVLKQQEALRQIAGRMRQGGTTPEVKVKEAYEIAREATL